VLALDVGTSSARALLFDERARRVPGVEVHLPYQPHVAADGTSEIDADRLLRLAFRAIDRLYRLAGGRRASLAAVAMSCFWHGLLATDAAGQPLTPVFLWSDSRSWRVAEDLADRLDGESLRQRTGCLLHPTYWPAKLGWARLEQPRLRNQDVRWLSFPDLLYWRLFGRPVTSVSMASGTGLLNLEACTWDRAVLRDLELDAEALPALSERMKGLVQPYARRWPALSAIPWFTAAGDGGLANLGSGCSGTEDRGLTVGTSGALRVILRSPLDRIPAGLWCYRLDRQRLVVGGALNSGGNLYSWLKQNLKVDPRVLERSLRKLPPGGHGLTFLPLLAGERSPGFASHARGAVAGLTLASTALDVARAGLEAVAVQFAVVNGLIDEMVRPARRLVASGAGLLHSPGWMQMMADAIGVPVAASRATEASSRGAAIYALEKLELLDPLRLPPQVGRTYAPDARHWEAYRQERSRLETLYGFLVRRRILDDQGPQAGFAQASGAEAAGRVSEPVAGRGEN
jgi:gluconokinase